MILSTAPRAKNPKGLPSGLIPLALTSSLLLLSILLNQQINQIYFLKTMNLIDLPVSILFFAVVYLVSIYGLLTIAQMTRSANSEKTGKLKY